PHSQHPTTSVKIQGGPDAQINLHGGTDRVRTPPGGIRDAGAGGVSQARDQRADLLPLEAQVCRHGDRRTAPAAPAGGRESPLETTGGGSNAGSAYVAGGAPKKALKPAQQKLLVDFVRVGFGTSERRACRVISYHRTTYRYRSRAKDQTPLRLRL